MGKAGKMRVLERRSGNAEEGRICRRDGGAALLFPFVGCQQIDGLDSQGLRQLP